MRSCTVDIDVDPHDSITSILALFMPMLVNLPILQSFA